MTVAEEAERKRIIEERLPLLPSLRTLPQVNTKQRLPERTNEGKACARARGAAWKQISFSLARARLLQRPRDNRTDRPLTAALHSGFPPTSSGNRLHFDCHIGILNFWRTKDKGLPPVNRCWRVPEPN